MSFCCFQFPPKNERKQVNLRYHSSKVEFVRSFFGRIIGLKKPFRLCLTFNSSSKNSVWKRLGSSIVELTPPNLHTAELRYRDRRNVTKYFEHTLVIPLTWSRKCNFTKRLLARLKFNLTKIKKKEFHS